MIVAELEELLAFLPQDMGVHVRAAQGCHHIDRVVKRAAYRERKTWVHDAMRVSGTPVVLLPNGSHPAALILEASYSAPLWCSAFAADVDYTVEGRWPAKALRHG